VLNYGLMTMIWMQRPRFDYEILKIYQI